MCPGNKRSTGERTPPTRTFLSSTRFPALLPQGDSGRIDDSDLLLAEPETGICRVLCFSPKTSSDALHDGASRYSRGDRLLGRAISGTCCDPKINYVQLLKTAAPRWARATHTPHCQIWSTATIPNIPQTEQSTQADHLREPAAACFATTTAWRKRGNSNRCRKRPTSSRSPNWAVWPFER